MLIGILDGAVSFNNSRGRFLSDGRDSRNIIRSISHQSLYIDKLPGRYMVLPLHILRIIIMDLGGSPACFRDPYLDPLICQLQKIPVAGNYRNGNAGRLAALGHRSQNIVCFVTRQRQDRDPHGLKDLFHQGHLLMKLLRHGLSRSLVISVHLMTEGGLLQIKGYRKVIRLLLIQNLKHNI